MTTAASKTRLHETVSRSEYDLDSTGTSDLSLQTTNEQDLPGYKRPSIKRRKLYDPNLIIGENTCLEDDKTKLIKLKTPDAMPQDPTSSRYLQISSSKVTKTLSDSMLAHDYAQQLAESINTILRPSNKYNDANISLSERVEKEMPIMSGQFGS